MLILRGEGPFGFLSSLFPIFLINSIVPSFLDVSSLSYGKVLRDESFNFLCNYELRSLSVSENYVLVLFPDSLVKVWESPGAE